MFSDQMNSPYSIAPECSGMSNNSEYGVSECIHLIRLKILIMQTDKKGLEGKTMRKLTLLVTLVLTFQLSGCAAMFHGSSDQITIQSADSDAKIYMDNVLIGKGTATASVKRNTQH